MSVCAPCVWHIIIRSSTCVSQVNQILSHLSFCRLPLAALADTHTHNFAPTSIVVHFAGCSSSNRIAYAEGCVCIYREQSAERGSMHSQICKSDRGEYNQTKKYGGKKRTKTIDRSVCLFCFGFSASALECSPCERAPRLTAFETKMKLRLIRSSFHLLNSISLFYLALLFATEKFHGEKPQALACAGSVVACHTIISGLHIGRINCSLFSSASIFLVSGNNHFGYRYTSQPIKIT